MSCHPALAAVDLLGFLTLGLLGGFGHCVGMCSPFVLFVSRRYGPSSGAEAPRRLLSPGSGAGNLQSGQAFRPALPALLAQGWYTAGRIVTYSVLGALAGSLGAVVQTAGALVGLRRGALLIAGAVLVAWAVVALSDLVWPVGPWRPASAGLGGSSLFTRVSSLLKRRVPGHPFATGLFLGLLPCGFLYSAVLAAVALGDAARGGAALALFGLGTAPALLGVSLADDVLARNHVLLNRLAHVFILVMGARFLWRGLVG